ncbi:hypothetical protein Pmani_039067 [Petrolisthes manimaculis]|uniref:Uncharacterized protein n=1 Tax=Petrolisthes manimaculis TaxID=1843537 RepID=A0AAE1NEE3_9EUCA|nr:hypothetical protein Pmani_039067 [Petrolisthes manimaculis]
MLAGRKWRQIVGAEGQGREWKKRTMEGRRRRHINVKDRRMKEKNRGHEAITRVSGGGDYAADGDKVAGEAEDGKIEDGD